MELEYSPADPGQDEGALVLETNDEDEGVLSVPLSGTGIAPRIEVSPASLDFGEVIRGASRMLEVTLSSTGTSSLELAAVALAPDASRDLAIAPFPTDLRLAPGDSATVEVTYDPKDDGPDSGALLIQSDDPERPLVAVPLTGTGIPPPRPRIGVSPSTLSFGEVPVGSTASLSFKIESTGDAALEVSRVSLEPGTSEGFEVTSGPAGVTLGRGDHADVEVAFASRAVGPQGGAVLVESNDSDRAVLRVPLEGTGVPTPAPEIEVEPPALDFGDVPLGGSKTLSFSVRNTGTAPLAVTRVDLGPGSAPAFSLPEPPATAVVPPGGKLDVKVYYRPAAAGLATAEVVIESDDADEPATTVPLRGRGVGEIFHRGDADQNAALQLTDAIQILGYLFLGTPTKVPECLDAADADDNGVVQLTDAIRILGFLFLGALPPAPPGPPGQPCGTDGTEDALDCRSYAACA